MALNKFFQDVEDEGVIIGRFTRNSPSSTISSNNFHQAYDTAEVEANGVSFNDTNGTFTVPETGTYLAAFGVDISCFGGDSVVVELYDGSRVVANDHKTANAGLTTISGIVKLNSGTTYLVRVSNLSQSFVVQTEATEGGIVKLW